MWRTLITLTTLLFTLSAQASWWNEGWAYRKQIVLDASATGANITEDLKNVPVLLRLHTGNFSYFLDIQTKGEDIRFVAGDGKTPLKYHIEKFDAINEIGLIWVLLPEIKAGSNQNAIWMYYGSEAAVAGQEASASFGTEQVLVYHFDKEQPVPVDVTAYANNASASTATVNTASLIGDGLSFDGQSNVVIADKPALASDPVLGWTFSTWLKIDAEQQDAIVLERDAGNLVVGIDGTTIYARAAGVETPRTAALALGTWHHIAISLTADSLVMSLDGSEVARAEVATPVIAGDIVIGASAAGSNGFIGYIDELRMSGIARSAGWLQAIMSTQGQLTNLVVYGDDGSQESEGGGGESHFGYVMKKLTFDSKVVIVFLLLMSAVSWAVMIMKALYLKRITDDNRRFLDAYYSLGTDDPAMLDHEQSEDEKELEDSPIAQALFGGHDHYQSSPIYHMYHRGIGEVKARLGTAVGAQAAAISDQSVEAIRATLDADMVRENQKINSKMVLLTIAISGGPFIGLLGTVIGVMITFAEMASTGDVSIASIAPGMAAALMATIAGLWVAIPALFGYNYLGSNIKDINADMRVFIDEFVTRVAEYYGK